MSSGTLSKSTVSLYQSRRSRFFSLPYYQEAPAYGADVLRLWVSSVDYTGDVMIGPQILRQMSEIYRKLRGTLRYLLANLHDWKVSSHSVAEVNSFYPCLELLHILKYC